MTDYQSLPPSVLAKIAALDALCMTLNAKLDRGRSELQGLRQQQRDVVPQVVHDEYGANREVERLEREGQRLTDEIAEQTEICERLERQLRGEERIVASCKRFLHELPVGTRLHVVEPNQGGDLDDIRKRIRQVRDDISRLQSLPVPSDDLADRIKAYVDDLAARAQPVIQGIGDGQTLRVLYPLNDDANRVNLIGFSQRDGNPLLLLALLEPERLVERLLQTVADAHSISPTERNERLHGLQSELTQLRYDEEAAICEAIDNGGDDVFRLGSSPAWAVLMVQIEHKQQVAA